jgi:hypothetical protein
LELGNNYIPPGIPSGMESGEINICHLEKSQMSGTAPDRNWKNPRCREAAPDKKNGMVFDRTVGWTGSRCVNLLEKKIIVNAIFFNENCKNGLKCPFSLQKP